MTMVRKEDDCLIVEEHACEAKKPRHEELEPGVLSGLSARLWALLRAHHLWCTANWDAFVFERDRQEDVESMFCYYSRKG
jgi:hypothetical protein